jgi:hypothetical protein
VRSEEEAGRRKEGGRRKEKGGRRKEEGGRRKEERGKRKYRPNTRRQVIPLREEAAQTKIANLHPVMSIDKHYNCKRRRRERGGRAYR